MWQTTNYAPPAALTALEAAILNCLVARHPLLAGQVQQCRVSRRECSGAGFFTTLDVGNAPPLSVVAGQFDGCLIQAAGVPDGADSLLFVREGRLDFLEVYVFTQGDLRPEATHFEVQPYE